MGVLVGGQSKLHWKHLSILCTRDLNDGNRYKDDYYFGHGTVYFIVVLIALFAAAHLARLAHQSRGIKSGKSIVSSRFLSRPLAIFRFFSYRSFAIKSLGWYSPTLGVILIGCAAWVYFGSALYCDSVEASNTDD